MELLSWSFKIFVTFNFLEILPLLCLLAAPPAVHHPTELLVVQLVVPWYVKLGKSSCDLGWGQVVAKLFKFLNREKDIYENLTLFFYSFTDLVILPSWFSSMSLKALSFFVSSPANSLQDNLPSPSLSCELNSLSTSSLENDNIDYRWPGGRICESMKIQQWGVYIFFGQKNT